jgi:amidohydrolase
LKADFEGTLVFAFQPAEEGGGGALAMIEDGLLRRWPVRAAFGLHNMPGVPLGMMGTAPGPGMAYADHFVIEVTGTGGHAAFPHMAADPIVAAAQLVTAFQTIVSRRRDPMQPAVISVTRIHGGSADNVIPGAVTLTGTVRTLDDDLAAFLCGEMRRQCRAIGEAMGVSIDATQIGLHPYPVCRNDPGATDFAVSVMREVAGEGAVEAAATPVLGGEDFAFFGREVPANFAFLGIGEAAPLHHPDYDFNDAAAPIGVAYWVRLAERALPRG